ncbi:MAG: 30S ribosomal protein S16 [Chloroflexi bacterium]|nr:30S ribosomal protein S16 [Chloroflexota bacterium]
MLRIRLRRVGAKKQPSYRIVITDARSPRDGAYVDLLGTYNPLTDPPTIVLDTEKAKHWLQRGAQPSSPVERMLRKLGVLENVVGNEGTH